MSMPIVIGLFFFCLGTVLGSFGNVIIFRVPKGKSIGGRSQCPNCGTQLALRDLVPIFSFLWLRGRCRSCKAAISWQYPLVEFGTGLLFVFALFHHNFVLISAVLLGLGLWLLLLIAIIDARTSLIPDALSLPFIGIAVVHGLFLPHFPFLPILLGGGFFGIQWFASQGRWVGSGDILLGIGIGALVGTWPLLLVSLFVSYILGATVAVVLLLRGKKTMDHTLSFGPFLCAGAMLGVFFGEAILQRVMML